MKIQVLSTKVVDVIRDESGAICSKMTKPRKISITYEDTEVMPTEKEFLLEGYGLVTTIRKNKTTLIVKT